MNPTRRNTMEDVHVAHPPGSWGAPNDRATFLGVYDGHGGRLIADYLEDHLSENIAKEWAHSESEQKKDQSVNDNQQLSQSKKRRLGDGNNGEHNKEQNNGDNHSTQSKTENGKEGEIIQTAFERAFLLTDIQSRMDGVTTSGATVVCCVVIPKFSTNGNLTSISIHAANAGDARAVLSSRTARQSQKLSASGRSNNPTKPSLKSSTSKLPNPELPNELPINRGTPAVRITHDHKSSDPEEIARIESSGGIMIRGRVLGIATRKYR